MVVRQFHEHIYISLSKSCCCCWQGRVRDDQNVILPKYPIYWCPTLRAVNVTLHVTMHVSLQLRQALDALLNDMKNLPARLKQYSSFEYVQKTIKTYLKVSNTMSFPTSRIDGVEPVNRDDVGRECFFSFVSLKARRTVHNRVA